MNSPISSSGFKTAKYLKSIFWLFVLKKHEIYFLCKKGKDKAPQNENTVGSNVRCEGKTMYFFLHISKKVWVVFYKTKFGS